MADARDNNQPRQVRFESNEPGERYALSGRIMLSAIVVLFAVVVFLIGLHFYARWYAARLRRRHLERRRVQRRVSRSQIVMYIDSRAAAAGDRGLDRAVLDSLPVFLHSPEPDRAAAPIQECAVCISEFEEKEVVRLLPRCGHSFHIECIDMWFRSHSTCPLCRSPVEQVRPEPGEKAVAVAVEPGSSSGSSPGRVDTTPLGARRKGMTAGVRIEVPPPRRAESENDPTQNSPAGRLLSLKRILSMGRWSPPAAGTSELDLESGPSSLGRN